MALTTDFSGTYDYEREEAYMVAQTYIDRLEGDEYTPDTYQQDLIRERAHWAKFNDFDMASFADEFNKLTIDVCMNKLGKAIYL